MKNKNGWLEIKLPPIDPNALWKEFELNDEIKLKHHVMVI